MDDGSFNKSKAYLILCTDSYSREEVLHLIDILKNKFNLSAALVSIKKKNKNFYYRVRVNKSSMPHLIELVKPYIIPSMVYKLGL